MDPKLIATFAQKLEAEKARLQKELASFAVEDKTLKGDWAAKREETPDITDAEEKADQAEEYDNLVSVEHSLEIKLKDVNSALEKITKGEYGKCEKCVNKIEIARLMAYPEARFCLKCNMQ